MALIVYQTLVPALKITWEKELVGSEIHNIVFRAVNQRVQKTLRKTSLDLEQVADSWPQGDWKRLCLGWNRPNQIQTTRTWIHICPARDYLIPVAVKGRSKWRTLDPLDSITQTYQQRRKSIQLASTSRHPSTHGLCSLGAPSLVLEPKIAPWRYMKPTARQKSK